MGEGMEFNFKICILQAYNYIHKNTIRAELYWPYRQQTIMRLARWTVRSRVQRIAELASPLLINCHQNPWVLSLTQRCHVNLFLQTPTWQTITDQTGLLNHSMSYFNTDAVCFSELRNSSGLFGNVSIGGAKTEKGNVCSSSFLSKFLSIA